MLLVAGIVKRLELCLKTCLSSRLLSFLRPRTKLHRTSQTSVKLLCLVNLLWWQQEPLFRSRRRTWQISWNRSSVWDCWSLLGETGLKILPSSGLTLHWRSKNWSIEQLIQLPLDANHFKWVLISLQHVISTWLPVQVLSFNACQTLTFSRLRPSCCYRNSKLLNQNFSFVLMRTRRVGDADAVWLILYFHFVVNRTRVIFHQIKVPLS